VARKAGDKNLADGLEGIGETLVAEAEKTAAAGGKTDLLWLRAHESALQQAAASKIGGLEEHETAKLARVVAEKAKGVLDEVLDSKVTQIQRQGQGSLPFAQVELGNALRNMHAATGQWAFKHAAEKLGAKQAEQIGLNLGGGLPSTATADLARAARDIRKVNRRFFALLTMQDALEARAVKEGVSGGPAERVGKKLGKVLSTTGAGGGLGGVPGAAVGAAIGAGEAVGGRVGQAIDRRLTARAIERLRAAATTSGGESPGVAIKALADELQLPERQVRAAYIRLLVSNKSEEARAE
jgi:hypothetical protein